MINHKVVERGPDHLEACSGTEEFGEEFGRPESEILNLKEPKNRFQGTNSARLCSLACRYDNPIPTLCLAPIDCLKNSSSMG
jgi:hypothetical protein